MSNTHNGIFLSNADGTLEEYATNSGGGSDVDTSTLADKTDISSIILAGSTNTTGETITAGTWFYLNGKPCVAKVDIASGATFTEGTNYEEKTVGSALAELNGKLTTYWKRYTGTTSFENIFESIRAGDGAIGKAIDDNCGSLTSGVHTVNVSGGSHITVMHDINSSSWYSGIGVTYGTLSHFMYHRVNTNYSVIVFQPI